MSIPKYPDFAAITMDMRPEIHGLLSGLKIGISEFTFANLYLFRATYNYQVSQLYNHSLVIAGQKDGKKFFMLPFGIPVKELLDSLFACHDYMKCLAETYSNQMRMQLEINDYCTVEDRDGFDYLYLRKDLADLAGRKYHKKRNLINAFINNYTYEEKPLTTDLKKHAFQVLEEWKQSKDGQDDYPAAQEGLEKMEELELCGYMYYANNNPAAYILGEEIGKSRSFAVHFEKAIDSYKGIYQFINQAFASILPHHYLYINREQDLGEPGLRQAKMSYRPSGFVKKYRVYKRTKCPCFTDTTFS
ncbi:MAG: DUF2156 domain-containing protein [Spirochaetota bacterium]